MTTENKTESKTTNKTVDMYQGMGDQLRAAIKASVAETLRLSTVKDKGRMGCAYRAAKRVNTILAWRILAVPFGSPFWTRAIVAEQFGDCLPSE